MAGIQDFNVVPYTSVLPKDMVFVPVEKAKENFFHGAVLEVIMAGVGATYSTGSTKGNIGVRKHGRNYILDSDDAVMAIATCIGQVTDVINESGDNIGGYVAEYVGIFPKHVGKMKAAEVARKQLTESLDNILTIRGYDKHNGNRQIHDTTYAELSENKNHGYALTAIGFLSFADAPAYPDK